jgi:hypothetical protein
MSKYMGYISFFREILNRNETNPTHGEVARLVLLRFNIANKLKTGLIFAAKLPSLAKNPTV